MVGAVTAIVAVPSEVSATLEDAVGWPTQNVPTSSAVGTLYEAVTIRPVIGTSSVSPAESSITT